LKVAAKSQLLGGAWAKVDGTSKSRHNDTMSMLDEALIWLMRKRNSLLIERQGSSAGYLFIPPKKKPREYRNIVLHFRVFFCDHDIFH
jgi:hypothetical protein